MPLQQASEKNALPAKAVVLSPVSAIFLTLVRTIVPEATNLDAQSWSELESLVDNTLRSRPADVHRQLRLLLRVLEQHNARTDIVYRCCYRACAGGPFRCPNKGRTTIPQSSVGPQLSQTIEIWDNDGIVNTASMLWPDGRHTLLVRADHMDIVGHYELVPNHRKNSKRKYDAYDLLKSDSGFDDAAFAQVWSHVFDFCTEELA
jgi:hypothetical protein